METGATRTSRPEEMGRLTKKDLDPSGWVREYDAERGRMFYFNTKTREATWEEPLGLRVRRGVRKYPGTSWSEHVDRRSGKLFYFNTATRTSVWDKPDVCENMPKTSLWTEHFDRMYGEKYWFNDELKIMSWESPELLAQSATSTFGHWAELRDAASHHTYYYHTITHAVSWTHPESKTSKSETSDDGTDVEWTILKDRRGRIYYRDKTTGENRWLPPHWTAIEDQVTGRYYYHNEVTEDTQWCRPGLERYYEDQRRRQGTKKKTHRSVDHVKWHLKTNVLKLSVSNNDDKSDSIDMAPAHHEQPPYSPIRHQSDDDDEDDDHEIEDGGTTNVPQEASDVKSTTHPPRKQHVLDFAKATEYVRIPLSKEKENDKSKAACKDMKRCLERGGLVLLHFSRTRKGKERFKFKLVERIPRAGQGKTMASEYAMFKKSIKGLHGDAFEAKRDEFMAHRHLHYLEKLEQLTLAANGQACIAVFRLQDQPDDPFLPPKFGDVVIVWCPNRGTMHMSMDDRMVTVPQTVEAVESFLDRNQVALARKLRRSAGGPDRSTMTRQKIGDPLEYSYVYHKLFQRAQTHELSAERKKQIMDERFHWKPPKTAKPVRKSKKELIKEDEKRGPFPPTGTIVHSFDPLVKLDEDAATIDKWQQRKLRAAVSCGNLVAFRFHPHKRKRRHAPDHWTYEITPLRRSYAGLDGKSVTSSGVSLEKEFNRLKRGMKKQFKIHEIEAAFADEKKRLMRARESEYRMCLETLTETYPTSTCVAIVRLQKDPEGYRQPPVFADAIVSWNPLLDPTRQSRKLTWTERAQTAAPTIQTIVDYLTSNGIVSSTYRRREACSVDQDSSNPLCYVGLYQKLFGRRPKHY